MTEAFTGGPWEIAKAAKLHGYDFTVVSPAGDAELGNWLVAGVRWEANARLIAAAPTMYGLIKKKANEGHSDCKAFMEDFNART